MYFIGIYIIYKNYDKKTASVIITICLIIQLLDITPTIRGRKIESQEIIHDNQIWEQVLEGANHIVCLGNTYFGEGDYLQIASIAIDNNCTMSNFYFAREIGGVKETESKYINDLKEGKIEENCVYFFKVENEEIPNVEGLYYYNIDDYVVITSKNVKLKVST